MREFFKRLPSTKHEVFSIDAQPIPRECARLCAPARAAERFGAEETKGALPPVLVVVTGDFPHVCLRAFGVGALMWLRPGMPAGTVQYAITEKQGFHHVFTLEKDPSSPQPNRFYVSSSIIRRSKVDKGL